MKTKTSNLIVDQWKLESIDTIRFTTQLQSFSKIIQNKATTTTSTKMYTMISFKSLLVIRLSCTISLSISLHRERVWVFAFCFIQFECQPMDCLVTINMIDSENELEFWFNAVVVVVVCSLLWWWAFFRI